jgi:hypothetical protein
VTGTPAFFITGSGVLDRTAAGPAIMEPLTAFAPSTKIVVPSAKRLAQGA